MLSVFALSEISLRLQHQCKFRIETISLVDSSFDSLRDEEGNFRDKIHAKVRTRHLGDTLSYLSRM